MKAVLDSPKLSLYGNLLFSATLTFCPRIWVFPKYAYVVNDSYSALSLNEEKEGEIFYFLERNPVLNHVTFLESGNKQFLAISGQVSHQTAIFQDQKQVLSDVSLQASFLRESLKFFSRSYLKFLIQNLSFLWVCRARKSFVVRSVHGKKFLLYQQNHLLK